MHITPTSFTPSPELQQQLEHFKACRLAYQEAQGVYQQTVQETGRLEQTAEALEAEAEAANASWKEMAKGRHADQRKINAEVERSVQLKMDAEKFRRTASVRQELHGELVVQMAEARAAALAASRAARSRYVDERLQALLATEGLGELLGELMKLAEHAGVDFGSRLAQVAKPSGDALAFLDRIGVPGPVEGEARNIEGINLAALKLSAGKTESIIEARRITAN